VKQTIAISIAAAVAKTRVKIPSVADAADELEEDKCDVLRGIDARGRV
jgi:hypothetical protein